MAYQLLMHNKSQTLQQLEQDYLLSKTVLNDYFVRIQQWCQKFNIVLTIKKNKVLWSMEQIMISLMPSSI